MLVTAENRQLNVYRWLLDNKATKAVAERMLYYTDNDGNSALHLSTKLQIDKFYLAPDAILKMQWEIKWYRVSTYV